MESQVELNDLEKELSELDEKDYADKSMQYRLRNMPKHKAGWDPARKDLMLEIKEKLKEYGEQITLNETEERRK